MDSEYARYRAQQTLEDAEEERRRGWQHAALDGYFSRRKRISSVPRLIQINLSSAKVPSLYTVPPAVFLSSFPVLFPPEGTAAQHDTEKEC